LKLLENRRESEIVGSILERVRNLQGKLSNLRGHRAR